MASRLNLHHHHSNSSAGFVGLVGNIVKHRKASEDDHTPDGVKPSKRLPATGLKRNTDEYKQEHKDCDGCVDDERPKARRGESGYSSSSSIPSDAVSDATPEREEDQEGALGRGKGRHERKILDNGRGRVYDSPTEDLSSYLGHKQNVPPRDKGEEDSLVPDQESTHDQPDGPAARSAGKDIQDGVARHREKLEENGVSPEEGGSNRLTWADDSDQKIISRNEEFNRKLTDEVGRYPEGLQAVKDEEPPGPRLDIVLDPRISHLHVRRFCGREFLADSSSISKEKRRVEVLN